MKNSILISIDNAFIIEKMFGQDADVFDNAILCELHLGFGSDIPISPHPQNIYIRLQLQTFCKVINPPKRWERDKWDSVYIYITIDIVNNINMNLRNASMKEEPLKIVFHKTEPIGMINGQAAHYTELIFEGGYWLKLEHFGGHIQNISNYIEYIQ